MAVSTKKVTIPSTKKRVSARGFDTPHNTRHPLHDEVQRKPPRFAFIDFLRSFAIILMIFTHVVALYFDHQGEQFLQTISLAGGTLCFTIFLLLFGTSNFFSYLFENDPINIKQKRYKLFTRALQIILVYYASALTVTFVYKNGFDGFNLNQIVYEILKIFYFQTIPPFTEFLISFALYIFTLILFRRAYIWITSSVLTTTIGSVVIYMIGYLLYQIPIDDGRLQIWKALFVGNKDMHTFPVFQYMPVFLFGIYLGNYLVKKYSTAKKVFHYLLLTSLFFALYLLCAVIYIGSTQMDLININVTTGRFPPSIGFITLGLAVTILLFAFSFVLFAKVQFIAKILQPITYFISKNALTIFFLQVVILFGYKFNWESSNTGQLQISTGSTIVLATAGVIILCILGSRINESIQKSTIKAWTNEHKLHTLKLLIICLAIGSTFWIFYRNRSFVYSSETIVSESTERVFGINTQNDWWDSEYAGRYLITTNQIKILNTDRWVLIELNHTDLLNKKLSLFEDAKDIRVVRQGNKTEEIPSIIKDAKTDHMQILFQLPDNQSDEYFIYFGNDFVPERLPISSETNEALATELQIGNIELKPIALDLSKKWHLKGFNTNTDTKLGLQITLEKPLENIQFTISDEEGVVETIDEAVAPDNLSYSIPIDKLDTGTYYLKAQGISISDALEKVESKTYRFFVSYPLFVNWSMDWEGLGVNQSDLDEIAAIAYKYSIPLTHYFNPRIYVKEQFDNYPLTPELAQYYTYWILNRKNLYGDEIGLHIHMFPDLLKELEIEVEPGAEIIGIGRNETRVNAYSTEELETVFEWSIQKFQENGLGIPKGFRAGAWMMDSEVFQALENTGFKYDSSGRTAGLLNPALASSNQIPWNLSATTKPYKPNISNINSAQSPTFDVWEFPDNGADSYWFTLEDLTNRFTSNYSYIMTDPQVVTYLSHPHWFIASDSAKIRSLFDYTTQFSYKDDKGPVVYSTLENIYDNFDLTQF